MPGDTAASALSASTVNPNAMRPSIISTAAAALLLTACYPDRAVENTALPTVTTLYDPGADFTGLRTFSVVDSVVHVVAEGGEAPPRTYDRTILEAVRRNLRARGYTEVPLPNGPTAGAATPPDVVGVVAASRGTIDGYYYDYWAAWGWWPYWPPGYGPGFTWYYPMPVIPYEFDTGSILISLVDARPRPTEDLRVPVLWYAAANAVVSGADPAALVTIAIDQAFEQSPYLSVTAPVAQR